MKIKILILLFLSSNLFAQNLSLPLGIKSPNAASLGKYGDVPVSLFTGAVNVSVPLRSLTSRNIPLNITLNYDASGVRVNSLPSWVGQNWSLNAGGVITRQRLGFTDEFYQTGGFGTGYGYFYSQSYSRLNISNWSTDASLENIYESNVGVGDGSQKDSQPDIFTFNFMGHTGKFFMGEDGQWKVASESNLKVEILATDFIYPLGESQGYYNNTVPKTIGKIQITDDKGVKYIFGSDTNPAAEKGIEYSKDFYFQKENFWWANAWYLVKVIDPNNNIAYTLTYERENYQASFYHNYFYKKYKGNVNTMGTNLDCASYPVTSHAYWYGSDNWHAIDGDIISPVYLKTIISNTETLTFSSAVSNNGFITSGPSTTLSNYLYNQLNLLAQSVGNGDHFYHLYPYNETTGVSMPDQIINKLKFRRLNQITSNLGAEPIIFGYNLDIPANSAQRLCLTEVKRGNSTAPQIYKFEYDRFEQLPNFLSRAFDHLGYFKGTEYPSAINYATHGTYRNTDIDKVKIGSLTKIIYPTKGYSEFIYEPHEYSKYVKDDRSAVMPMANTKIGGLRIKQMTISDDNNNIKVHQYKYVKNWITNQTLTTSSGVINNIPKYWWPDFKTKAYGIDGHFTIDSFSLNSILPLSNFSGAPVTYDEVTEIFDGGYKVYKYTNQDDYRDEAFVGSLYIDYSPYLTCNDRSLLRGKLKSLDVYNPSISKVQSTVNEYDTNSGISTKYARSVQVDRVDCGDAWGALVGNCYRIYYFDNDLKKSTQSEFFSGNELKTINTWAYQYYPSLTASTGNRFLMSEANQVYRQEGESGNEKLEKVYSYPFSISSGVNTSLINQNKFPVLKQETKRNGVTLSTDLIEYAQFTSGSSSFLLPKYYYKSKGAGTPELSMEIDAVNSKGDIIKHHKTNGSYTMLGWSYNGEFLVAKIEGTEFTSSQMTLLSNATAQIQSSLGLGLTNWATNLSSITTQLSTIRGISTSHIALTYAYDPRSGQPHLIIQPDGRKTYYHYDQLGRLSYVTDDNSPNTNMLYRYDYNFKTP